MRDRSPDTKKSDLLDWTITAAPEPEAGWPSGDTAEADAHAPESPASVERHARRFSRWMWLTLGSLIVVSITSIALYARWNESRLEQGLRQVVVSEEKAALAQDTRTLEQLTADGYTDWLKAQTDLARQGLAAPAPSLLLIPLLQAGQIEAIKRFSADIMQVDVSRPFATRDGSVVRYALPQYYQYQGRWKRIPPPDLGPARHQFDGQRLSVGYPTQEDSLMTEVGPYLDEVLQRACAEWGCAADFRITLHFLNEIALPDSAALSGTVAATRTGPDLFALLAPVNSSWLDQAQLLLPAPHRVGYPTDAAGREAFKRLTAQQMLLYAVQRLKGFGVGQRNAFAYALAARTAGRLQLENPATLNVSTANLALGAATLWDMEHLSLWDEPDLRQEGLRGALAITNVLLNDEPPDVEHRLFQNLWPGQDFGEWLLNGLGQSEQAAYNRLLTTGKAAYALDLPPTTPQLALSCSTGPALWWPGLEQPVRFLSGPFLNADVMAGSNSPWSPDGERLMLALSGQPAAAYLASGKLTWLPAPQDESFWTAPLAWTWTSRSRLAYLADPKAEGSDLRFFDFARPDRQWPEASGLSAYTVSPDEMLAAVVRPSDTTSSPLAGFSNERLEVSLTISNSVLATDSGTAPVWSPDSAALAYVHFDEHNRDRVWLRRMDLRPAMPIYVVTNGDTLWDIASRFNVGVVSLVNANKLTSDIILPGQTLQIPVDAPAVNPVTITNIFDVEVSKQVRHVALAWSPDGAALLTELMFGPADYQVLVFNPQGVNHRVLYSGQALSLSTPRFSGDGRYVAFVVADGQGSSLRVYATKSGDEILSQAGINSFAWSPIGHELALVTDEGVRVLADPHYPNFGEEEFAAPGCGQVWWNPASAGLFPAAE